MKSSPLISQKMPGFRPVTALGLLVIFLALLCLGGARPVSAWDSAFGSSSSHYRLLEDVIDSVPLPAADAAGESTYHEALLDGSINEAAHGQKRSDNSGCSYGSKATGTNAGTTHPEYWWQEALCYYRLGNHYNAYSVLGKLIHLVQDQTSVPHSYNVMHGGSYGMDNFEILSAVTAMDYTYYTSPGDSVDHPGKNILNEDTHYDGADANWTLNYNVYSWTEVTSTILQVPQPLGLTIDTSIVGCGSPDHVYLKAVYDRLDGTTGEQILSNFSPRCTTWTRWILTPDNFAPNGLLTIYYQRNETCCSSWEGQLQVYVTSVSDAVAAGEFPRPSFRHPWEYYDYLREWSLWATRAPYYPAYNSMSHVHTPLDFSITWTSAPNTERALLTLQWDVTSHALRWFLQDAYAAFANPAYTVDSASGSGYRVVLFDDIEYNSSPYAGSPEYAYSHSIACEPYAGATCGAYIPPVAPVYAQFPVLDDDYQVAASGDLATLTSDSLGFMEYRVSSLEIRRAKVTFYASPALAGAQRTYLYDTPDLGAYSDWARSVKIEPPTVPLLSGIVWFDRDSDGVVDAGEPPLPDVELYILYNANNDGNLVVPPGGFSRTDKFGVYQFTSLFSGSYLLGVDTKTLPPDMLPTYDTDGAGTPNDTYIYLPPGYSDVKEDFGYWRAEVPLFLPLVRR